MVNNLCAHSKPVSFPHGTQNGGFPKRSTNNGIFLRTYPLTQPDSNGSLGCCYPAFIGRTSSTSPVLWDINGRASVKLCLCVCMCWTMCERRTRFLVLLPRPAASSCINFNCRSCRMVSRFPTKARPFVSHVSVNYPSTCHSPRTTGFSLAPGHINNYESISAAM